MLHQLAQTLRTRPATPYSRSTDFGQQNPDFTERLRALFAPHGSDKSTTHDMKNRLLSAFGTAKLAGRNWLESSDFEQSRMGLSHKIGV
ncbi:MAG: hypothetical protein PHT48_12475 [Dechloromonas sp.]|nr:hypothetical protein [Dechloromonas sp.]